MEASQRRNEGDEALKEMLNIIYFLSWNGNMEQPHLITVHHQNNNGVYLRDFKRWLSELRGREMSESFAWSYKSKYKTGYIWKDLTDEDLIIPTSDCEYVLKGSFLTSPIKIAPQKNEENQAKSPATSTASKSPLVNFQIEENISPKLLTKVKEELSIETLASTSSLSSKKVDNRTTVFKVDAWREEMMEIKKRRQEEIIKENERKFKEARMKEIDCHGSRKWALILSNLLRCGTIETRDSVMRAASNQSGRRSNNSSNNEVKFGDERNQRRNACKIKSFFFFNHVLPLNQIAQQLGGLF